MTGFLRTLALCAAGLLAACGGDSATPSRSSKFRSYSGPEVTQIQVHKGQRKMYLLSRGTVLKSYDVGLGNNPVGHKQYEGDGKTPEGVYFIDRHNPQSRYHLSLGVSYPNPADKARAAAVGLRPGGNIMIHGQGPDGRRARQRDWTAGCIAVTDAEIEDIYAMVRQHTPVIIQP